LGRASRMRLKEARAMAKDKHGMPVPSDESSLPWNDSLGGIRASDGK